MTQLTQHWHAALVLVIAATIAAPARASGPDELGCAAPFEGSALSLSEPPAATPWSSVATSRGRTGVIAVWSEREVAISRDDGRSFQPLKGRFVQIQDVVVGKGGTVFVLDRDTISTAFARGHVRRVQVPKTDTDPDYDVENIRLVVGAGYLGFVSRAGLALTKDYGASWQIKEFPSGWVDEAQLSIASDGTIGAKVTIYNCHSGDYDLFYRGSIEGPWTEVEDGADWLSQKPGFDYDYELDALRLYRLDARGERHVVREVSSNAAPITLVRNGHSEYARFSRDLYRLAKGKVELVARDVPKALEVVAVDRCDRLLGLYKRHLVRWSSATGWRELPVVSP